MPILEGKYPDAALDVEYARPDKVYEAVLEDRADLGLVSYPESNREITAIPWRDERMAVAACPAHPLAKMKIDPTLRSAWRDVHCFR